MTASSTQKGNTGKVLPFGWQWMPFQKAVSRITTQTRKLQTSEYLSSGLYPIIDQGQQEISGYTNDESCVITHPLPLIVFGDHTKVVKYIDYPFAIGADGVVLLSARNDIALMFLFFWLKQINLRELGYARHYGILKNKFIPLPPLPEQRRIASSLNGQMEAVEKARASAEARLEAAKALPAAYLREVFESEEVKKWPRRLLGDVCNITARLVDPKNDEFNHLPHVFGNNIESGMCRLTYLNTAKEDGMTSGKYLFEPGAVLYSKLRPYLRKSLVADFRGLCSADMYPITVNKDILDPYYTAWMLLSEEFTKYADEKSRRSRMPKLNREQLFAWKAPIPPLSEQQRMINIMREKVISVEVLRGKIREELESIKSLPAAFLRKAFNGEL